MPHVPDLQYAERLDAMDESAKVSMLRSFEETLAAAKNRHPHEKLDRVEQFMQILSGERPPNISDPRQKPSLLFFPGLTAKPWHEKADFPWFEKLEQNYLVIKEELNNLLEDGIGFYQEDSPTFEGPQKGWRVALLDQHGRQHRDNIRRCPRTMELIEGVPHGLRECQFSSFDPGTHVQAHHGIANVILTCHIALTCPESGSGMKVADEVRWQEEGKGLIFDDTYLHEAWNHGDSVRIILMWDVWHPELTAAELDTLIAFFPIFEKYLLLNSKRYLVSNGSVYVR